MNLLPRLPYYPNAFFSLERMVFHLLAPFAIAGAREGVKWVDKKLMERENRKAHERLTEQAAAERRASSSRGAPVAMYLPTTREIEERNRAREKKEAEEKALAEKKEKEEREKREKALAEKKERDETEKREKILAEARKEAAIEAAKKEAEIARIKKEAEVALANKNAEIAAERKKAEDERIKREEIMRKLKEALEAQREAEDALLRGIPPDVRPTHYQLQSFRKEYGYQVNKFHVAVVGESGMGKSTFLNAARGLAPGDPGYARSSLNECTTEVTRYEDPRHFNLVWYDVPGANTPTITGWTYFMDKGLFAFDALVIVFCDRFTQTVGTLLKNAKTCNKPVYLVRTKADQLMSNLKYEMDWPASEEELKKRLVEMTRDTVRKNMELISMPTDTEFYLVSRDVLTDYAKGGILDSEGIHERKLLDDIYANKTVVENKT
ncbi:hypothetical protein CVT24_012319 [Panaeolus cyanescens]|uniref:IRG-type G domain-containing protein n=1 Tax=Panaeolus cyanescens TaxID=181874 RepID=A0A409W4A0_9AGAR|nr:hypothetical protein CVT24_012319 [Panaeolus cyanescens]